MNRSTSQPMSRLDPAEAAELRKALLQERQLFSDRYREEVDEARDLRDESIEEPADLASMEIDRNLLLAFSEADRERVEEIEAALRRMDAGTYGLCEKEGEPIPLERLRQVPWARCCAKHQAQVEEGWLELSGLS